jgi:ADP-ribosylglycohydrolase
LDLAGASAEVTHNHPDAIAGAQATAAAIYMARTEASKAEIGEFITEQFGYNLTTTVADIRQNYRPSVSCKKTVPESIVAFLESNSYEETIRNAIWIGGDADTMAAIAGSIAEPFWGIPTAIKTKGLEKLPADLRSVLDEFYREHEIDY